ncbi:MAG: DUF6228 family protein [Hyphomicrobiaceae bacterium]
MGESRVAKIKTRDGEGYLAFHGIDLDPSEAAYEPSLRVEISIGAFCGSSLLRVWRRGPDQLFDYVDQHWRGWEGIQKWQDESSNLQLEATVSSLGDINLKFEMRESFTISVGWHQVALSGVLILDGSSIQMFAADLRKLCALE